MSYTKQLSPWPLCSLKVLIQEQLSIIYPIKVSPSKVKSHNKDFFSGIRIAHSKPALRIHTSDYESGSGFCDFRKRSSSCLLLFEGTFTSFSKIKSHKEVSKQQETMFFLLFLLDDRRIRIKIHIFDLWIRMRIREVQKHMDPTDAYLDPQHCSKHKLKNMRTERPLV